jgi:hypothetical protein
MAWDKQRSDFQVIEFYKIIDQKGYEITWEKSAICPCIPKDSHGQPDVNCPLCLGKGRYWFDPKNIKGIMTSFQEEARWNQTGEIMSGTSYITTLPENKLGFWDRMTNVHSLVRYSEIVVKGNHDISDRLRFKPADVLQLRTVKDVFTKNVDFKLNEVNQTIDWIGNQPNTGIQYTVEYECHPRWICIDLVNVLRDTQVKSKKPGITFTPMPVRAVVRLEFFVF